MYTPTTFHHRRYTALGGLQFDKDLRCILTAFQPSSSAGGGPSSGWVRGWVSFGFGCCAKTPKASGWLRN